MVNKKIKKNHFRYIDRFQITEAVGRRGKCNQIQGLLRVSNHKKKKKELDDEIYFALQTKPNALINGCTPPVKRPQSRTPTRDPEKMRSKHPKTPSKEQKKTKILRSERGSDPKVAVKPGVGC